MDIKYTVERDELVAKVVVNLQDARRLDGYNMRDLIEKEVKKQIVSKLVEEFVDKSYTAVLSQMNPTTILKLAEIRAGKALGDIYSGNDNQERR